MLENWGAGDQPFDAANLIEDCANDGQVGLLNYTTHLALVYFTG